MYVKRLKRKGKKVIFDSHEDYYTQIKEKHYIPKIIRNIVAAIYRIIENSACKHLDAAIIPSLINGKNIFEGRVKNCEIINNCPIIEETLNKNISMVEKKPSVCCVGSLTQDRGVEVLVDACYMANVKLILAGNISPKEFKDELMKKKEFENVDYRGVCNREEVIEIYNETLIGASNILHVGQYYQTENLPTKVYEYMMMSMPFIISDFRYPLNVIKKHKCGIAVDPSNAYQICEAILYLCENIEEAQKMGERGRKAIEEEFNWGNEERKLYRLYETI